MDEGGEKMEKSESGGGEMSRNGRRSGSKERKEENCCLTAVTNMEHVYTGTL